MSSAAVRQPLCDQKSDEDGANVFYGPCPRGNITSVSPSCSRPSDTKQGKSENAAEAGDSKMAKAINHVGLGIENGTKEKLIASSVAIQSIFINSLLLSDESRRAKVMHLLEKAFYMNAGKSDIIKLSDKDGGPTEEPQLRNHQSFWSRYPCVLFCSSPLALKELQYCGITPHKHVFGERLRKCGEVRDAGQTGCV